MIDAAPSAVKLLDLGDSADHAAMIDAAPSSYSTLVVAVDGAGGGTAGCGSGASSAGCLGCD
jgi:hypothetical protein